MEQSRSKNMKYINYEEENSHLKVPRYQAYQYCLPTSHHILQCTLTTASCLKTVKRLYIDNMWIQGTKLKYKVEIRPNIFGSLRRNLWYLVNRCLDSSVQRPYCISMEVRCIGIRIYIISSLLSISIRVQYFIKKIQIQFQNKHILKIKEKSKKVKYIVQDSRSIFTKKK